MGSIHSQLPSTQQREASDESAGRLYGGWGDVPQEDAFTRLQCERGLGGDTQSFYGRMVPLPVRASESVQDMMIY